jgi:hypothetical protein
MIASSWRSPNRAQERKSFFWEQKKQKLLPVGVGDEAAAEIEATAPRHHSATSSRLAAALTA